MDDMSKPNQHAESTDIQPISSDLDFSKLTHQNWLFINAFLGCGSVTKAYKLAKYEGTERTAPYQLFKRLKQHIEALGDLDVTSRARLQADVKSLLDIPLEEKKSLTLKEFLEVRKFVAKITPEAISSKPNISVLVINRPAKEAKGTQEGDKPITSPLDSATIIDVTPLP